MTGQDIVTEARTWVGVPWRLRGRDREGLDCVGLLAVVADKLGIPYADDLRYGAFFNTDHMLEVLLEAMGEVPRETMQTGDVLVLDVRGERQHTAFYDADHQTIIHATSLYRKVVEHTFNDEWQGKVRKVLRVKSL
jgi:cell wall-associated NlpC family hydrolase